MTISSKERVSDEFWKLTKCSLNKLEWDIRVGDLNNQVVAIRSDDYHAKVLELSVSDIEILVEQLGYSLIKK